MGKLKASEVTICPENLKVYIFYLKAHQRSKLLNKVDNLPEFKVKDFRLSSL